MELYILSDCLKEQGFKLWPGQRKALNEVLMFQDGSLFVSQSTANPYRHKLLLKQIKSSRFQETSLTDADKSSPYDHVHPSEIVKTQYERDLDIVLISPFQTITEVIDPEIRFYRSLHEDAKPRVQINSLWLAVPEVTEKLEPFLFPVQGTTKFVKTEHGVFHADTLERTFRTALIGDDALTLYFELNEANPQWKVDK